MPPRSLGEKANITNIFKREQLFHILERILHFI